MITQEELKSLYSYDPATGLFKFLSGRYTGRHPRNISPGGYRRVCIERRYYQQHRLAFLYMLGTYPLEVDHINGERSDNRWENLRAVTRSQNNMNSPGAKSNNVSGLRGAHFKKRTGLYTARIKVGGREVFLGNFPTAQAAHDAYCAAAILHFGAFARVE